MDSWSVQISLSMRWKLFCLQGNKTWHRADISQFNYKLLPCSPILSCVSLVLHWVVDFPIPLCCCPCHSACQEAIYQDYTIQRHGAKHLLSRISGEPDIHEGSWIYCMEKWFNSLGSTKATDTQNGVCLLLVTDSSRQSFLHPDLFLLPFYNNP